MHAILVNEKELFEAALGVQAPWVIDRVELDVDEKSLDIWVDFEPGARFPCPECGASDCPAYDTQEPRGGTWTSSSTKPISMPAIRA